MSKGHKSLTVNFLGGVGEIGKNMTALKYGDEVLIIDCGSIFPTQDTPGIDLIIPDFTFIRENKENIKGLVITHGHEDHIGAVPYLLKEFPDIQVYGSSLALALIKHKLEERDIPSPKLNVVEDKEIVKLGSFSVEFVKVAHSIIGSFGLAINTPAGLIYHTGDYKIDYTPIDGMPADIAEYAKIGARGVKLMLGESTNIEKPGTTISEKVVGETLDKIISTNTDSRIIIATFASNVNRIQQIINICEKYGRKVAFSGRSMINIAQMALDLGLIKTDASNLVNIDSIQGMNPCKTCILSTGSQGEPMSALTRMAKGEDKVVVGEGDLIVISSSAIPGNEKAIYNVINNLCKRGAKVMYGSLEALHTSGHACQEELKLMLSLIKPQFFIPLHGEYRHLKQHAKLAEEMHVEKDNIAIAEIGNVIEVKQKKLQRLKDIQAGSIYVDGLGGVDKNVLKDRKRMSNEGIVVETVFVDLEEKDIYDIEIVTKGIILEDKCIEDIKAVTQTAYNDVIDKNQYSKKQFEDVLAKKVTKLLAKKIYQKPIVIPVIIEQ